ncbi:hypothetical protein MMMDOFMJ_4294 [Methylobacterium gnaphalii]|nr:hypothetical protein MMMDOFMJ_4294 [Methylobacterium gnaphalii]
MIASGQTLSRIELALWAFILTAPAAVLAILRCAP